MVQTLGFSQQATLVFISNANLDEVSRAELYSVYSLSRQKLEDDSLIIPHVYPNDHASMIRMSREIFDVFPYQLTRVWDRRIFTGRASMPVVVTDTNQMIEQVGNTPGSIGFIVVSSPDELAQIPNNVNVLKVINGANP